MLLSGCCVNSVQKPTDKGPSGETGQSCALAIGPSALSKANDWQNTPGHSHGVYSLRMPHSAALGVLLPREELGWQDADGRVFIQAGACFLRNVVFRRTAR